MYSREIESAFENRKTKLRDWLSEHPLRQVQWEATRRCDMQCLHCGSNCTLSNHDHELTESEIVNTFASITAEYPPSSLELISVTGGEPLLREDLPDIICQLNTLGFSHITVQTNGNRLNENPQLLTTLVDAGLSGLGLNLDGLQESHDQLRCRKGHFKSMCHLAERILRETPLYLTITTVVSKSNLADLSDLYQIIIDIGIHRWRLIELQPMGRAHKTDTLYLDQDDFCQLVEFVKNANTTTASTDRFPSPIVELACTGWYGQELEGIIRPYIWHCHAGVSTLGIWSNGDIGGCTDIDHTRAEGNVRTDSIIEVWKNRFHQYRDWDSRKTGECQTCDQWPWCHGGALHLRTTKNELSHCPYLLLNRTENESPSACQRGEIVNEF